MCGRVRTRRGWHRQKLLSFKSLVLSMEGGKKLMLISFWGHPSLHSKLELPHQVDYMLCHVPDPGSSHCATWGMLWHWEKPYCQSE